MEADDAERVVDDAVIFCAVNYRWRAILESVEL